MAYILDWSSILFARTTTWSTCDVDVKHLCGTSALGSPQFSKDTIHPSLEGITEYIKRIYRRNGGYIWCYQVLSGSHWFPKLGYVWKWGTPPFHAISIGRMMTPKSGDGAAGQWTGHKMSTFLHAPTRTQGSKSLAAWQLSRSNYIGERLYFFFPFMRFE